MRVPDNMLDVVSSNCFSSEVNSEGYIFLDRDRGHLYFNTGLLLFPHPCWKKPVIWGWTMRLTKFAYRANLNFITAVVRSL